MTLKDPSFLTGVEGEIALVKPTGVIEFWKERNSRLRKVNEIRLCGGESAALTYAREKGWKETHLFV
jgi:hypothetical protein